MAALSIVSPGWGDRAAYGVDPCQLAESRDIELTIGRYGYYQQTAAGVEAEARSSEVAEAEPSPFQVRLDEAGMTGFRFPEVSFEGLIGFRWGTLGFEELALNWNGQPFGFGTEAEMAAAAGPGEVVFRFDDVEGSFFASFSGAAWSLPTPEFAGSSVGRKIDPSKPVTFQWSPLVRNAGTEVTAFRILEESEEFGAGDTVFVTAPCRLPFPVPRVEVMAPDATSITVPAGVLTNRQARYLAELSITRYHATRSGGTVPTWSADLVDQKLTRLRLTLAGEMDTTPILAGAQLSLKALAGGASELTAFPTNSGMLILLQSVDLRQWHPWRTQEVALGAPLTFPLRAEDLAGPVGFFRAKSAEDRP